jgi:RNA recognition motif-containing protein
VKNIPKDKTSADLDKFFSVFGKVKFAKISIKYDYSSRGYGYVLFSNESHAQAAIEKCNESTILTAEEYKC